MLKPAYAKQFECDANRLKIRGKNLEKLKIIIRLLVAEEPLDDIHRDHKLICNWQRRRECHIESDWLLEQSESGKRYMLKINPSPFLRSWMIWVSARTFIAFLYLLDFDDAHLAVIVELYPVTTDPKPVTLPMIGQSLHILIFCLRQISPTVLLREA